MQDIIVKLKSIEGQELKYKKLCEALNLPVKTSNSKKSQLKNLQIYCQLIELDAPKRYLIKKVYDEELEMLGLAKGGNKYQLMFEAAVYQAFLKNNGKPLYLSNMDAIKLFKEVNDNFTYACNSEDMKAMGVEYEYMPEVAKIVYRILRQWTMRRIDSMNTRHTALKETGYRLYKEKEYKGRKYITYINVPKDSELSKKCQAIYSKTIDEIMPEGWGIENSEDEDEEIDVIQKDVEEEKKKKKSGKYWVPEYLWNKFETRIQQLVQEEFNGDYKTLKPIMILRPPTSAYVKEKLEIMCQKLQTITHINEEACQKALTTKQLDHISADERKRFIETNMNLTTKFSFKEELKKKRTLQGGVI